MDGALIFSCDGGDQQFVVALDRDAGKVRWRSDRNLKPTRGFSFSTPLAITINGVQSASGPTVTVQ